MCYRLTVQNWVVYSVGPDWIDNGRKPAPISRLEPDGDVLLQGFVMPDPDEKSGDPDHSGWKNIWAAPCGPAFPWYDLTKPKEGPRSFAVSGQFQIARNIRWSEPANLLCRSIGQSAQL